MIQQYLTISNTMQKTWISVVVSLFLTQAFAVAGTASGHVALHSKADASSAVVYLTGDVQGKPLQNAVIDQRDRMFYPHVTVVTVGTIVRFPNDDNVLHNVFAYYNAKKFDLGMYPRGQSKEVIFDKPGVVDLLCNIHPDMSAYIMVVDTPYFSVASKRGQFEINGVPAGVYTLHAWHESGEETQQQVTIADGTNDFPVDLKTR
jgi:plastocyanin